MLDTVTIGIPIYKRLGYLANVLRTVREQDYPRIELIVSDNGQNGHAVDELVRQYYPREYAIRRNPHSVHISTHYNQLINCASGEFFILLADDDEISPTFVSSLVSRLEDHTEAHVAIGRQEIIDETGTVIRRSTGVLPDVMDGFHFIHAAWKDYRFGYECFATTLARTDSLRRNGGYPPFHRGTHNDDAVLVKLALQGPVVFSNEGAFRWRVYPSSHGWSLSVRDLARDSAQFLRFLHRDQFVRTQGRARPHEWRQARVCLEEMAWVTFQNRWNTMYQERLGVYEWLLAPLWMPWTWRFQRRLFRDAKERIESGVKARLTTFLRQRS